ncbi:MAG: phage head spike fiber domain-containing protein [Aeromonas veronii]
MIYREGLGRPLSWAELDSNFKSVDDIGQSAQAAASSAQTSAATASSAQQSATSSASEAKTQAVLAKGEADRAKQITGLDTVENAVAAASAPFPDVWIPFNDSVRILAGRGDDVRVGAVTVATCFSFNRASTATYVDKSGTRRVAAVDEPRFESEGLLIEGQSTNIITRTEGLTSSDFTTSGTSTVSVTSRVVAGLTVYTATMSGSSSSYVLDLRIGTYGDRTQVATYSTMARITSSTAPVFLKGVTTSNIQISATQNLIQYSHSETVNTDGYRYIGFQSSAPFTVEFCALQCELMPFATSYIPTFGTAATRAADFPRYKREGNDNYFRECTIAVEVHTMSTEGVDGVNFTSNNRKGIFSAYPSTGAHQMIYLNPRDNYPLFCYGTTDASGGGCPVLAGDTGRHIVVARFDGVKNSCFTDGVKGSVSNDAVPVFGTPNDDTGMYVLIGYGAGSTTGRHLFGHVRNLRIWHRALSDTQIKSIR